jgi:hypothetical protein
MGNFHPRIPPITANHFRAKSRALASVKIGSIGATADSQFLLFPYALKGVIETAWAQQ